VPNGLRYFHDVSTVSALQRNFHAITADNALKCFCHRHSSEIIGKKQLILLSGGLHRIV
jgi:hypothetical protein